MIDLITAVAVLLIGPFVLIWWLPHLVHETGHALAARAVGARFDYFPLGPILIARDARGPRVRGQLLRFSCDAVLPLADHARTQLLVVTIGGPVASIGFGIALALVGLREDVGRALPFAPLVLLIGAFYTVSHGVMALFPWRPYGVPSDGRRLLSLIRASGRRWIAIRIIAAASDGGARPRDWPIARLRDMVRPSDGSTDDVAGALALYWHFLDDQRIGEARMCLEQARAAASRRYMSEQSMQVILLESAYLEARYGADPRLAGEHLLGSAFFAPAMLARAVAALLLVYAYWDGAEETAEAAKQDLRGLRPGFARMEHDLLSQLADEARARRDDVALPETPPARSPAGLDVTLFATPDTPLLPPQPPPGLVSARSLVGLVSSAAAGLSAHTITAAFSRELALPVAVLTILVGTAVVLHVRFSRGARQVELARHAFGTLAIVFVVAPIFLFDLFLHNSLGYIWISGEPRPCVQFGGGHDLSSLPIQLWGLAFAMLGLLMGTRARSNPLLPGRGIFVGFLLVALWIVAIGTDHGRFAALIGCR